MCRYWSTIEFRNPQTRDRLWAAETCSCVLQQSIIIIIIILGHNRSIETEWGRMCISILTPQPPVSFFVRLRDQPRTATAWVRDGSSFPWAVDVVKYKWLTFPMHHQIRWYYAPEGRHENPGQTWWWLTVIFIITAAGERVQRCEEISFAIILLSFKCISDYHMNQLFVTFCANFYNQTISRDYYRWNNNNSIMAA